MKKEILIVDDHTIFRQGLRLLIEKEKKFVVRGEASSGRFICSTGSEKTGCDCFKLNAKPEVGSYHLPKTT